MSQARSGGPGDEGAVDADPCDDLRDPARLRALEHTGLDAEPDAEMDFYAGWVHRALGVPVALVSLVGADRQVFPGMVGLPEPWAAARATPLSHSFCRHVVATARPLTITDAREDPLVRDNPAIRDLGVVAYADAPLLDDTGNVLGALCAIDTAPRTWTGEQLDTLRDIARACSGELRLRLARYDASREGDRRDEFEEAQRRAYERSQTLLLASQAFTGTRTVDDVRVRIGELVATELRPSSVGVVLLDERGVLRWVDAGPGRGDAPRTPPAEATLPAARALREQRIVHHPDRESFDREHPQASRAVLRERGLHTVVAAPLPAAGGPVGAVVLGWPVPHAVEPTDLLTLATIADYAGQAVVRARLLHHRITVAHELQAAMLTRLPSVDGLTMAARYEPADSREDVGGDWFDAARVEAPALSHSQVVTVSVGDVLGHTLHAATVMGQVRSMLRQAAWDHPAGPPSRVLGAFEAAERGLDLGAAGSAVVVHLCRPRGGRWSMTWTNAGHPPPVLLLPDGRTELLADHDAMFGFRLTASLPRRDLRCDIVPGSTLFLYTDGLVERRGSDIDSGIDALRRLLDDVRDGSPQDIVDAAVSRLAPDADDDVVAFAIRFPA